MDDRQQRQQHPPKEESRHQWSALIQDALTKYSAMMMRGGPSDASSTASHGPEVRGTSFSAQPPTAAAASASPYLSHDESSRQSGHAETLANPPTASGAGAAQMFPFAVSPSVSRSVSSSTTTTNTTYHSLPWPPPEEADALSCAESIQTHGTHASSHHHDRDQTIPGFSLLSGVLDGILPRDKAHLLQAAARKPQLVREESNPEWFLQREQYNAVGAARKMAKYWDLRGEYFMNHTTPQQQQQQQIPQQSFSNSNHPDVEYSPLPSSLLPQEVNLIRQGVHEVILVPPKLHTVDFYHLNANKPLAILDLTRKTLERATGYYWQWNEWRMRMLLRTLFLARSILSQKVLLQNPSSGQEQQQQDGSYVELVLLDSCYCSDSGGMSFVSTILSRTLLLAEEALPLHMTSLIVAVLLENDTADGSEVSSRIIQSLQSIHDEVSADKVHIVTGKSPQDIRRKLERRYHLDKNYLPRTLGGKWQDRNRLLSSCFPCDADARQTKESDVMGDSKPAARPFPPKQQQGQDSSSPLTQLDTSHVVLRTLRAMSSSDVEEYEAALNMDPRLILHETNPAQYLEAEGGNAGLAATKIAAYWKIKKQICGDHLFLQPLDTSPSSAIPPASITCLGDGSMMLLPAAGPSGEDCMYINDPCTVQCVQWRNGLFFALSRLSAFASNTRNGLTVIISATHPQWYQLCVETLFQFAEEGFVIWVKNVHVIAHNPSSITRLSPLHDQWLTHFDRFKRGTVKGRIKFRVANLDATLASLVRDGYKQDCLQTAFTALQKQGAIANALDLWCAARLPVNDASQVVKDVEVEDEAEETHQDGKSGTSSSKAEESSIDSLEESSLRALEEAILLLPEEDKAAYCQAKKEFPDLVKKETPPLWFLKHAKHNTWDAAKRLCYYWKQRLDIFQERAFLPMNQTGEGALSKRDVNALSTGYYAFLPKDNEGRTVVLNDASRRRKKDCPSVLRHMMYFLHIFMQNEANLDKGGLVVIIVFSRFPVDIVGSKMSQLRDLIRHAFPVSCHKLHIIPKPGKSRTILDQGLPIIFSFFPRLKSNKFFHSYQDTNELIESLEKHGLSRKGLPTTIGGSWSYDEVPNWQEQRIRMEWDLPLGHLETGQESYRAKSLSELTEEERLERKRRYNVIHSRRKRRRDKLESEILERQVDELTEEQESARKEHTRLTGLLNQAQEIVATL